jgi:hypothetical protein
MNVSGKKKSFKSTCGVKGGNNLGTILFIFMIQAVSTTLDKKWDFETPDFNWPSMKADGSYKWNSHKPWQRYQYHHQRNSLLL